MAEFDVLILGGGPAGISAAMWADELGLSSAIVDRGVALGGQLFNVFNPIKNYPGAEFENGTAMAAVLAGQIGNRSTKLLLGREVTNVDTSERKLTFADGSSVSGRSLILATGVRRRRLDVPGESEFLGKGILTSGAKDPTVVSGKTVAVIGGGDAALENALILAAHAKRVLLIHRGSGLSARPGFVSKVIAEEKIELILDSEIVEFPGHEMLNSVEIKNKLTNHTERRSVDHALIRIGFQPNSDLFRDQVNCDAHGYVQVDVKGLTTVGRVYAGGDLWRQFSQTVSSAVGDGTTAISNIAFNHAATS